MTSWDVWTPFHVAFTLFVLCGLKQSVYMPVRGYTEDKAEPD